MPKLILPPPLELKEARAKRNEEMRELRRKRYMVKDIGKKYGLGPDRAKLILKGIKPRRLK